MYVYKKEATNLLHKKKQNDPYGNEKMDIHRQHKYTTSGIKDGEPLFAIQTLLGCVSFGFGEGTKAISAPPFKYQAGKKRMRGLGRYFYGGSCRNGYFLSVNKKIAYLYQISNLGYGR